MSQRRSVTELLDNAFRKAGYRLEGMPPPAVFDIVIRSSSNKTKAERLDACRKEFDELIEQTIEWRRLSMRVIEELSGDDCA